ncbi:MAG: acyltransferase [Phycisphaerales bacterium]|nr:acyltransferase [Phycisphaerales bacterium]
MEKPQDSSPRMLGLDLVRGVAAIGVIWVHVGRSPEWASLNLSALGAAGTAYLNILAGFFTIIALQKFLAKGQTSGRFLRHRFWRIGAPFVVWSGVYLAARGVNYLVFGKVTGFEWDWTVLFYGTIYHLWFLPYLIMATVVTFPMIYLGLKRPQVLIPMAALMMMLAASIILLPPIPLPEDHTDPFRIAGIVIGRLPGFLLGLGFGMLWTAGYRPRVGKQTALVCLIVAAVAVWLTVASELPQLLLNRVAGVCGLIAAFAPWRGVIAQRLASMGALGFGVYLSHVLFVELAVAVMRRIRVEPSITTDLIALSFVVLASFGLSHAIRNVRALRWLIP